MGWRPSPSLLPRVSELSRSCQPHPAFPIYGPTVKVTGPPGPRGPCVWAKLLQSCLPLWNIARQAPPIVYNCKGNRCSFLKKKKNVLIWLSLVLVTACRILQARILGGLRALLQEIEGVSLVSPALAGAFFTTSALPTPHARVLLFSNSNSTSPDLRLFPRSLGANNNPTSAGHWENLT